MVKKAHAFAEQVWKTLSSRPIYQNRWLSLREDLVELPDGRATIYGVVTCGECVGILPFLDKHLIDDPVLGRVIVQVVRTKPLERDGQSVQPRESSITPCWTHKKKRLAL